MQYKGPLCRKAKWPFTFGKRRKVDTDMNNEPARLGTWLTALIRAWLERAEEKLAARRFGGDQKCPWCNQWQNQFADSHRRDFAPNPMLDELVCGNCGGTSLWKWEMGFILVTAARPPDAYSKTGYKVKDGTVSPFIQDVTRRALAALPQTETTLPAPLREFD